MQSHQGKQQRRYYLNSCSTYLVDIFSFMPQFEPVNLTL
jgi:hypothetical protein